MPFFLYQCSKVIWWNLIRDHFYINSLIVSCKMKTYPMILPRVSYEKHESMFWNISCIVANSSQERLLFGLPEEGTTFRARYPYKLLKICTFHSAVILSRPPTAGWKVHLVLESQHMYDIIVIYPDNRILVENKKNHVWMLLLLPKPQLNLKFNNTCPQ